MRTRLAAASAALATALVLCGRASAEQTSLSDAGALSLVPIAVVPAFEDVLAAEELPAVERRTKRLEAKLAKANRRIAKLEKALNLKRFKRMCRRPANIVQLGRCLQADGFRVSENPAFGGVDPVHAPGSLHYPPCSCAIDVNWMGGNEMLHLDGLYPRLARMLGVQQLLWRVPNHFNHLHVAFP